MSDLKALALILIIIGFPILLLLVAFVISLFTEDDEPRED